MLQSPYVDIATLIFNLDGIWSQLFRLAGLLMYVRLNNAATLTMQPSLFLQ